MTLVIPTKAYLPSRPSRLSQQVLFRLPGVAALWRHWHLVRVWHHLWKTQPELAVPILSLVLASRIASTLSHVVTGHPSPQFEDRLLRERYGELYRPHEREKRRVIGYVRVSTKKQVVEGESLFVQEQHIREFVTQKGWTLVDMVRDAGKSGRFRDRPGIRKIRKSIKAQTVDVIIVDRLDRFSRDLYALLGLVLEMKDHGVVLISLTERVGFDTPEGYFILQILGAAAEYLVTITRRATQAAKINRVKTERIPNGRHLFGYCNGRCSQCTDPNGKDYCPYYGGPDRGTGVLRSYPHPIESRAYKLMVQWSLAGLSDREIAHRINRTIIEVEGVKRIPRTKGNGRAAPPGPFSKDAVRDILRNRYYAGWVTYVGYDERGRRRKAPLVEVRGRHVPLISDETFRRLQTLREARYRGRTTKAGVHRVYPLRSVLVCAQCREPMRGHFANGKRYYRDANFEAKHPKPEWHQKAVPAHIVEEQVWDLLRNIALPEQVKRATLGYLFYQDGPSEIVGKQRAIMEQVYALRDRYLRQEIGEVRYRRELQRLERELERLDPERFTQAREALRLLDDFGALFDQMTDAERLVLVHTLFQSIRLRGRQVEEVVPYEPFRELFRSLRSGNGEGKD